MKTHLSPPLLYSYPCFLASLFLFLMGVGYSWKECLILYQWPLLTSLYPVLFYVILDPYSTMFSAIVLFIAANVLLFTGTYMSAEPFILRFTHLVLLFVLSMLLLIFFPNLVTLMIGWDGLGVVSFILVIYYSNPKSLSAGVLTALTNRLGDALLIISLGLLVTQHHYIPHLWSAPTTLWITMATAAFTKSAQVPFSAWLPAAMAAPTPISALVHSSTLVTAGVYLLFRLSPSLLTSPSSMTLCQIAGATTMFIAGTCAMVEADMKKIIALSTLSQLGLMTFSFGLGLPYLTYFHMATHAIFKALMFICMGHMIYMNAHNQDMRSAKTGATQIVATCFIIASLALAGTPFLSAFYSKDAILEMTPYQPINLIIYTLCIFSTGLTTAYSSRLLISSLPQPPSIMSATEDNMYNPTPMVFLSLMAIVSGAMLNWTQIQPLALTPLCLLSKTWPFFVAIIGIFLSTALFITKSSPLNTLCSMMYLTPLSSSQLLKPMIQSNHMLTTMDQGWNELLGGTGINKMNQKLATAMGSYEPKTTLLQLTTSLILGALLLL